MVAAASPIPMQTKKTKAFGIPTIDLSAGSRPELSKLVVEACENYGFFKVVNHGVPAEIISRLEDEVVPFFGKAAGEKQAAGPATPFGYGCKNIGRNGDVGEVEYLLLHTNPTLVSQRSATISSDPSKFSCAVNDYVQAARDLACELLDLTAEGLCISDKFIFSKLIRDVESDSILRINHYPPLCKAITDPPSEIHDQVENGNNTIGFGEHYDPQILTILRSNDVGGLQILLHRLWVPISADPTAFYVLVGDAFQALTNGRFESIKHRVMANSETRARTSIIYSAAPPPATWISPAPEMVKAPCQQPIYRPFTWDEFKSTAYSYQLADPRLDRFKIQP